MLYLKVRDSSDDMFGTRSSFGTGAGAGHSLSLQEMGTEAGHPLDPISWSIHMVYQIHYQQSCLQSMSWPKPSITPVSSGDLF